MQFLLRNFKKISWWIYTLTLLIKVWNTMNHFTSDVSIFFLISFFRQGMMSSKYFKVQNEWYHILWLNYIIYMYVINYLTIWFISVLSLANILTDLEWFKGIQYLYLPIKNLKNRSIHPGTLFRYELGVVPSHIETPSTGSGYLSVKIFLILKKKINWFVYRVEPVSWTFYSGNPLW